MNKKIKYEELIKRNQPFIDSYVSQIKNVKIDDHLVATVEEYFKHDNSFNYTPSVLAPSETFIDAAGYRPFYQYSDLMMECIKKIIQAEEVNRIIPKEGEKPFKWLMRVKKRSSFFSFSQIDFDVWNHLYSDLISIFSEIHRQKVEELESMN
ncbi:MAG: hypothetical protein RLZZ74_90 [Cyanobacteriota bacterium]|jgi:hypothetical protein